MLMLCARIRPLFETNGYCPYSKLKSEGERELERERKYRQTDRRRHKHRAKTEPGERDGYVDE